MAAFEGIALVRRAFFLDGTCLYAIDLGQPARYHVVGKTGGRMDEIDAESAAASDPGAASRRGKTPRPRLHRDGARGGIFRARGAAREPPGGPEDRDTASEVCAPPASN